MSDVEYLAQTMYQPDTYIVQGFNPGMPAINKPPIGLTDQEILCVIAYLQSLGGTPTVTLQSSHRYYTPAGGAPRRHAGSGRRSRGRTGYTSGSTGRHAGSRRRSRSRGRAGYASGCPERRTGSRRSYARRPADAGRFA